MQKIDRTTSFTTISFVHLLVGFGLKSIPEDIGGPEGEDYHVTQRHVSISCDKSLTIIRWRLRNPSRVPPSISYQNCRNILKYL
jgi:hypothetical protein